MSTITRVNNNDITGTSAVGGAILDLGFLFTQTVETDYYLFSFFFFWGLFTTILFFSLQIKCQTRYQVKSRGV